MNFKFHLHTKRKEKLIQIVMTETVNGRKTRSVKAMVPYNGGRYSMDYELSRSEAMKILELLDNDKREGRKRLSSIAKNFVGNTSIMDLLEDPPKWFYLHK